MVSEKISGPIVLGGHSAGGHLVSSIMCLNTPLKTRVLDRVRHVMSISGVQDLRPLLNTTLNQDLKLDLNSAANVSPALRRPLTRISLTMVGASERPDFIRQTAFLTNIWLALGARVLCTKVPDKHHLNVIDYLFDDAALISMLTESA